MADPATVAETFLNCINSTFTVTDTAVPANTWSATVTDGGVTVTTEEDDMTNNKSGAAYESVGTILKHEADVTIAYESTFPATFVPRAMFHIVIDHPLGPYFSGNWRVISIGNPVFNVKGGLKLPVKLTGQGAISRTRV